MYIKFFIKFNYYLKNSIDIVFNSMYSVCVFVCTYMYNDLHMKVRGQLWNSFSPSIFMSIWELKLKSSGLGANICPL